MSATRHAGFAIVLGISAVAAVLLSLAVGARQMSVAESVSAVRDGLALAFHA